MIPSYGRPGNKILVSPDGNGTTWSNLTATKAGISSGYTSIVALTRTTALQVGDHGSNWCFPAGSGLRRVGICAKTIVLGTNLAPGAPVAVGPTVSPMPVMCLACRPTLATPHRGHRRQAYIASLAYQLKQADTFSDRGRVILPDRSPHTRGDHRMARRAGAKPR